MNRPGSISITVLLVTAIGGLVGLAVGAVLLLSVYANFKNTTELVLGSAEAFMESLETDIEEHLMPAAEIVDFLVRQAKDGKLDPALKQESGLMLKGALAAAPQVTHVAMWQPDGRELFVTRIAGDQIVLSTETNADVPELMSYLETIRASGKPVWNEPFRVDGSTVVSIAAPMFHNGEYIGVVGAGVSVEELSALVTNLGRSYEVDGFILYGKDKLLAHPKLSELPTANLGPEEPLHSVVSLNNGILEALLSSDEGFSGPNGTFEVRVIEFDDEDYMSLTRTFQEFGNTSWTIGAYSLRDDWDTQIIRLYRSIIGGVILLVVAVAAAILLSRRVAAPIRETAQATLKIGDLDLDKIDPLPPSRITELNNQANAFNQMLEGLKWFEAYVPRQLVKQLIRQNDTSATTSKEMVLTVMFTDIVGFTANSETKQPAVIATELNQHFEIINNAIEAEGGTLDKYIGDAVMAFWGAPDAQDDHAKRACKAALRIQEALAAHGQSQKIKIAIHTGPLIVGNIGATGRMNYTVIGDTVNTCSRIENLAGDLESDLQATILISDATADYLDDEFDLKKAGEFEVRGRKKPVTVFHLSDGNH